MSRFDAVSDLDYQESYGDPMPRSRCNAPRKPLVLRCVECGWTGSVEEAITHSRLLGHAVTYKGTLQQFTERPTQQGAA